MLPGVKCNTLRISRRQEQVFARFLKAVSRVLNDRPAVMAVPGPRRAGATGSPVSRPSTFFLLQTQVVDDRNKSGHDGVAAVLQHSGEGANIRSDSDASGNRLAQGPLMQALFRILICIGF